MAMRCPHCGSTVEPGRDAAGRLVCPACRNTGRIQAPQPAAPASAPPAPAPAAAGPAAAAPLSPLSPPGQAGPGGWTPAEPAAAPGKAVAAMTVGIAAIVVFPLAIVLGPIALVLGIQALRKIKRMPVGTPGQGMAVTGIVLGAIGIMVGITVVMAAVVFVLVSNLSGSEEWAFDVDGSGPGGVLTVTGYPGLPSWSEFGLGGTATCRLPSGDVMYDDQIVCTSDGTVILFRVQTNEQVYATEV